MNLERSGESHTKDVLLTSSLKRGKVHSIEVVPWNVRLNSPKYISHHINSFDRAGALSAINLKADF